MVVERVVMQHESQLEVGTKGIMRKYFYLIYDLCCICAALVLALYLRHGFPLIQEGQPEDLTLLLLVTLAFSFIILTLMQTHTGLWRFTSGSELATIIVAVGLVVLLSNSTLFLVSRLDMVPRSVPPMHWALAVAMMSASRLLVRQIFGPTRAIPRRRKALKQHVLVVGVCHTAELYLEFAKRIMQHQVIVEGFLDSNPALKQRTFHQCKILGSVLDIPRLMGELLVHGVHIKQVILAQHINELSDAEKELIRQLESQVEIVHFARDMAPHFHPLASNQDDFYHKLHAMDASGYSTHSGTYRYLKRMIDMVLGLALMILLLPLMALTSFVVALDVGLPLMFWQQRPGLRGKPFRLYKFRTMRSTARKVGEERLEHKSGDMARTSAVGRWLRQMRLDELPQLFHIIVGTMSFVGPRPLLPDDQPAGGEARLGVRPGVTGWAQIHGGDALTPEEKLVLDLWYIRHMSLWLDMSIIAQTFLVLLSPDSRRVDLAILRMATLERERA